jgi:hypothetical protein
MSGLLRILILASALVDAAAGLWFVIAGRAHPLVRGLAGQPGAADGAFLAYFLGLACFLAVAIHVLIWRWLTDEREEAYALINLYAGFAVLAGVLLFLAFRAGGVTLQGAALPAWIFLLGDSVRGALLLAVANVVRYSPSTLRELRLPAASRARSRSATRTSRADSRSGRPRTGRRRAPAGRESRERAAAGDRESRERAPATAATRRRRRESSEGESRGRGEEGRGARRRSRSRRPRRRSRSGGGRGEGAAASESPAASPASESLAPPASAAAAAAEERPREEPRRAEDRGRGGSRRRAPRRGGRGAEGERRRERPPRRERESRTERGAEQEPAPRAAERDEAEALRQGLVEGQAGTSNVKILTPVPGEFEAGRRRKKGRYSITGALFRPREKRAHRPLGGAAAREWAWPPPPAEEDDEAAGKRTPEPAPDDQEQAREER